MKRSILIVAIIALLVIAVTGLYIVTSQTNRNSDTGAKSDQATATEQQMAEKSTEVQAEKDTTQLEQTAEATPGKYIAYSSSALTNSDNVIFFAASWCPTCRGLDRAINSELNSIPANLTILKADYDSEIELRQKYGVTYQHTLVQVDANGNLLKKWNGGQDIASIVSQLL
jgi:thiol-disulfide isomerase/thioredoxin